MVPETSKFAGGDQAYLRDEQYRNAARLQRRGNIHARYRTAPTTWFDWVAPRAELFDGADVLEAGCGPGWLWAETAATIPSGVDLTLTDLSPGMVAEAVERGVATNRFSSVCGEPADLLQLPFPDGSFDRVIANHMLHHLSDPAQGVCELARVVRPDDLVLAATNGRRHMQELWQIRAHIFDLASVDRTVEVFRADTGFAVLRANFGDVRWAQYDDSLRCTDPADVLAYVCSTPPAEDADREQLAALTNAIEAAFEAGGGTMTITKDVGAFVCRSPRRDR